jgi:hypothetical protein
VQHHITIMNAHAHAHVVHAPSISCAHMMVTAALPAQDVSTLADPSVVTTLLEMRGK